ncbi:TonB-dependent receptor [Croceicoccus pelagius]|uniref:TonB-dependent receptor n=1 Tax=Croceicoccus pelagius TaxID=1703341 RepID=A0A916YK24_9SPHN|nr:TonB-dependent receptor [Croceicoccus pelagius]
MAHAEDGARSDGGIDGDPIIVLGTRIVEPLADLPPEDVLDPDAVASYGAGTIGEVIDAIQDDYADAEPTILVDGRPIPDRGDIDGFPPEAIERVEILPQGSAVRVGGAPGERVYNVVLKPSVASVTATVSHRMATEGGFSDDDLEAVLTRVKGRDRLNLSLAFRDSSLLTESERDVDRTPVAGVDERPYRSLRPASRGIDMNATGSMRLLSWLDLQAAGRMNWARDDGLNGSAFAEPLTTRYRAQGGSLTTTLLATSGQWQGSAGLRVALRDTLFRFDNPETATATIGRFRSGSKSRDLGANVAINAPLVQLPAGLARLRTSLDVTQVRYDPRSTYANEYTRTDRNLALGLSLPVLAGPRFGRLTLDGDLGRNWLSGGERLERWSLAANWQVRPWIQFTASTGRAQMPVDPDLLTTRVYSIDNISVFDPVVDETVYATLIYGGNPELRTPRTTTRRFAVSAAPARKINLQLSTAFVQSTTHYQIGAVPPTGSSLIYAFPERFVRDASGRLITVDSRPVNFGAHKQETLQTSIAATIPLSGAKQGVAARPQLRLNASHSMALSDTITLQDGAPAVDLLEGGVIGVGGGRTRHTANGTIAVTKGTMGLQLDGYYTGVSLLSIGTVTERDRLRFGHKFTMNLRGFVGLGSIFETSDLAKKGRLSGVIANLTKARRLTSSQVGNVPEAYQLIYSDPIGRTVAVELRLAL